MKLPIPQLFAKKDKESFLLGVLLHDERIQVIIFRQDAKSLRIITYHEELLPTSLESISHEDLVQTFDKAIGFAESKLPANATLKQTIFGVKQGWVEDAKIKKEHLLTLKKISEELDLTPIGFIVFTESLSHLLSKEQGVPVSGILVELEKSTVTLSILRAGKIVESKSSVISQTEVQTVDNLLQQITDVEILPSKIIISAASTSQHVQKQFASHTWSKTLPFLHAPQPQLLEANFELRAIASGTATQLGVELIETELAPEEHIKETVQEEAVSESREDESIRSEQDPPEFLGKPEAFGFIQDQDKASMNQVPTPSSFQENKLESPIQTGKRSLNAWLQALPSGETVVKRLKTMTTAAKSMPGKPILFVIPGIIIVMLVLFLLYATNVKATVSIALTPQTLTLEKAITIAPKGATNFAQNTLHGSVVQVSEDGSVTTPATGKKDVGDKAKGSVTFFNSDSRDHSIPAGTSISSETNVSFTLDKDVMVASASGDVFSGTKPGTTDGTVTAVTLGTEGNLPSGTKFTVAGVTAVAAKNNSAFSGGSKKQVTVVSDQDLTKLLTDLPNQLLQKGKDDLSHQTTGGAAVLPNITNTTITKKNYTKKVGDEATSVTLDGTVTYQSISYDTTDLMGYGQFLIKDKLADATKLAQNSLKVDISTITLDSKQNAQATATLQAATLPILNTTAIAQSIKGKSFTMAQSILQQLPQFQSADIHLSPDLFFVPKALPGNESHISVSIRTQ